MSAVQPILLDLLCMEHYFPTHSYLTPSCLRSFSATPPTSAMLAARHLVVAHDTSAYRHFCPAGVAVGKHGNGCVNLVLPRFVPPGLIRLLPNGGEGVVYSRYAPCEPGVDFGVFIADFEG